MQNKNNQTIVIEFETVLSDLIKKKSSLVTKLSQFILKTLFPDGNLDQSHCRSTINDGLKNTLLFFILTHDCFKGIWEGIKKNEYLSKYANKYLINLATYLAPTRPHQLTTKADYTTWDSLTDRTWSGRHLPPMKQADVKNLPPVDEVTRLFCRKGEAINSEKSSVLFSYFVQWFIDGVLVTSSDDELKNSSPHNINLSQLYGFKPEVTENLRSHQYGKLKSQKLRNCKGLEEEYSPYFYKEDTCFDDVEHPCQGKKNEFQDLDPPSFIATKEYVTPKKLKKFFAMGMSKGKGNVQAGFIMMNILFLREHNDICNRLIKEYDIKTESDNKLPKDWQEDWQNKKQQGKEVEWEQWLDERLFQTARNILIVLLLKIIIQEYINHITPYHFKFTLDSLSFMKESWYRQNWMAIEFNLLYRWHSSTPDEIDLGDQKKHIKDTLWATDLVVQRGLGPLFEAASLQPCGKIGLHNTAPFLLQREESSLRLGRKARLASYNAYRELCKLPKVTDFDQITRDKDVQNELRDLYGHVDKIELYTGLFAEDNRPGSPLAPLMARLVAIDAFSQVITNPLLADTIFSDKQLKKGEPSPRQRTFTEIGCRIIEETKSLSDILHRNIPQKDKKFKVSMAFSE